MSSVNLSRQSGQIAVWLRPGQHVVLVQVAVGPWQGREIASIEGRPGAYLATLSEVRVMAIDTLRSIARLVASNVRSRVIAAAGDTLTDEDEGLICDLLLLAALREVIGNDLVQEAGLARLAVISSQSPSGYAGAWRALVRTAH